jgi:hypothetical protein
MKLKYSLLAIILVFSILLTGCRNYTPTYTTTPTFVELAKKTKTVKPTPRPTNTLTPTPTSTSSPTSLNTLGITPSITFLPTVLNTSTITPISLVTYFVSPTGSDLNPGTLDKPWKTLQKAGDTAVPGDIIKILPGIYNESLIPKNSGTPDKYIIYTSDPGTAIIDGTGISLNSSGKQALIYVSGKSYIKIENLGIKNSTYNCISILNYSSFIDINNMNIQNCREVGIYNSHSNNITIERNTINHVDYSSGIGIWYSENILVTLNTITNSHYYHECQGAHEEALTISGVKNFEVSYNTLDNTEPNPPGFCENSEKLGIDVKESSQNGAVYNNIIHHMNAASIYVDAWHAGSNGTSTLNHINIYGNYISNSAGIVVGCEQSDGIVEYINIYNNVLYNVSFSGIQVREAWGNGLRKNITIYNNTIYGALPEGGNGGAGIYVTTSNLGTNNGDSPVIIRNNIVMFYFLYNGGGTLGQIVAGNLLVASMITADHNLVYGPQRCSLDYPNCLEVGTRIVSSPTTTFYNPSVPDLHLKAGANAIDTGINISIVTDDFDKVARPQPIGGIYDIGAYEYKN